MASLLHFKSKQRAKKLGEFLFALVVVLHPVNFQQCEVSLRAISCVHVCIHTHANVRMYVCVCLCCS